MRKKNFDFFFEIWVLIFLLSSYDFTKAEENDRSRQTFVIRYKDGEQTIPVTVVLDYKKQTEYVLNMNPRTPAKSVTLYDFKQRTIAYKDLANNECFLGRLTHETLSEESHALKDLKSPVDDKPKLRSLYPGRPALTPTEIRNIAGQKTAAFCGKLNTWLLMPEKEHDISKREADDDYEERTYHHQGYHTVQYSHYGRETRRRNRNPSRSHSHRSHRIEDVAENQELVVPEPEHHLPIRQSSNAFHPDLRILNNGDDTNTRNTLPREKILNSQIPQKRINEHDEENDFSANNHHSGGTNVNKNHFGYQITHPNFEAKFSSIYGIPPQTKQNSNFSDSLNAGYSEGNPTFNSDKNPEHLKTSSIESRSLANVLAEEGSHARTERATSTTDISTYTQNQEINYPNVHPSLSHLLPVYKPLSREFQFDPPVINENGTFPNNKSSHQRNIESEFDALSSPNTQPKKHIFFEHANNPDVSENPDVSTNVLEIPKITREFENINRNYVPQLDISRNVLKSSSQDNYPHLPQIHSNSTRYFDRNSHFPNENFPESDHLSYFPNRHISGSEENFHLEEDISYIPPLETFSTTESPILTTLRYFVPETSSNNAFVPGHRTSHQNSASRSLPHVIPNYISNNDFHSIPSENNLNMHPNQKNETKLINRHTFRNIQNPPITTEKQFKEEKPKTSFNHRSDIPSEDSVGRSLASEFIETNTGKLVPNETANEGLTSYKIRLQNVLRDFKPDEIVIDIENIPTPMPPSVTSSFQQNIFTTIQPNVRSLPFDSVRSDIGRRSEQTLETTWRDYIPTTRHPRKRIQNRTRKPVHNEPSLPYLRNSQNQNNHQFKPPNRIIQNSRVNHFIPAHQPNRHQFHHPSGPNPSSILMPAQPRYFNTPNHYNQLSNLPPGVSVHPRHPQAPFADMVHSNRPPTIPLVEDKTPKHHRHRHQKKKDRQTNSCCRLRGKPGSLQACCRNGGHCCSRSHMSMQTPGSSCCSSPRAIDQVISSNQIQPSRRPNRIQPLSRPSNRIQQSSRATNHIQLPLRTESLPRSAVDNKDRCEKEKMCRTVYESTQKVMVCRNAHVEGC